MSTTEEEKPTTASETPEVAAETSTKEEEKKATPAPEEAVKEEESTATFEPVVGTVTAHDMSLFEQYMLVSIMAVELEKSYAKRHIQHRMSLFQR